MNATYLLLAAAALYIVWANRATFLPKLKDWLVSIVPAVPKDDPAPRVLTIEAWVVVRDRVEQYGTPEEVEALNALLPLFFGAKVKATGTPDKGGLT